VEAVQWYKSAGSTVERDVNCCLFRDETVAQ
jgi:hypothetical protein